VELPLMPGSLPARYLSSSWRIPTRLAPVWWPAWPAVDAGAGGSADRV